MPLPGNGRYAERVREAGNGFRLSVCMFVCLSVCVSASVQIPLKDVQRVRQYSFIVQLVPNIYNSSVKKVLTQISVETVLFAVYGRDRVFCCKCPADVVSFEM